MNNTDKAVTGGLVARDQDAMTIFHQKLAIQRLEKQLAIANRLAESVREMALVSMWGKSSPLLAKAQDALAQWESEVK